MSIRAYARFWPVAVLLFAGHSARAEFNPEGRSKRPKSPAHPPATTTPARPRPATAAPGPSAAPAPAASSPAETSKRDKPEVKGPSSEALIERYTAIVLSQPGADFPLQRLLELYRERDGKLDALVADLARRAEAGGATRYAALIAIAGIEKLEGRPERAQAAFERAIGEDAKNPIAVVALARMLNERGDKSAARARFEQALPTLKDDADREQVLRTLLGLCLDLKDYDSAKRYHEQLVKRAGGSFIVRAEFGRELLARGAYERAAAEYKTVVQAAIGDNRVLAPALRDYGKALEKLGKREEALAQYRRALSLAGESGVRREIVAAIVDSYRQRERLPELIAELEKRAAASAEDLRTLGALYEETGQVEKALATYRRALAADGKDLATRLKVVHLLEVRGDLEQAIAEYDALIKAAPRNPDFVFQLAEALISRGDRKKALTRLQELEARSQSDEETLAALVDFYERVDEKERALSLLQRLANSSAADPEHLVELGTRYWQEGDKKKALATWQRIKAVLPDRARALQILGELYLEHDMPKEALVALAEAAKLSPKQPRYRKAYALALERTSAASGTREGRSAQFEEARKIWEELIREAQNDATLAREARQHIITLYSLEGQLAQRVPALERRLAQKPPDLEAGRLLAEAHLRLRRYPEAERVLTRVIEAAPGDSESESSLERVLVLEHKLREAINVLEKLAASDPKRAREYYQRMASYAAELYQDDEAVRYAARAVELSPDDAEGHKKLGEMYRKRQDVAKSISEFRQAISKNERLFPVYLELAELLLGQGETDDADMLLRRVIRASPDEELISQAARLSMQVNLGRGTLESLERDLLPLALNSPERPIYRQLLLEVYGALAYPLLEREKSEREKEAEAARSALDRLGERAVKPLLDALSDPREAEQEVAITLLSHVQNKSAGPTLFSYATGNADSELRTRAMLAVGMLRDPALVPRFEGLLLSSGHVTAGESDPVLLSAVWSVARMRSPRAEHLLSALSGSDSAEVSALGLIGLSMLGSRASAPHAAKLLRQAEAGPLPRAAAAYALAEAGQKTQADVLTELSEASDPTLSAMAVLSLARLNAPGAPRAVADALSSLDPLVSRAGGDAALTLATGSYRKPKELLPAPDGSLDVRRLIDGLRPSGYSGSERVAALEKLSGPLSLALGRAAAISPDRARGVAALLVVDPGQLPFAPLTEGAQFTPAERARLEALARELGGALLPTFSALARHPSPEVRLFALRFLGQRAEPAAKAALAAALKDELSAVRRAALTTFDASDPQAAAAVIALLDVEPDWALRALAVTTLGRIAAGNPSAQVVAALSQRASKDAFALVRESALEALVLVDPVAAKRVLSVSHDSDPEPRVKARAQALLQRL
ncbi:MAG TPA: tetratricopeptide repeat protein [Polyangiaceae bacterium]|nr:tetratricopeptide repeat protein [Polyangiaceae bacterium]